ncbi:hypothetical protein ATE62_14310 [Sphingopyxis sp. HIX]|uniref:OmpA family protein n=1 Tax=Sphingopyxis sp. HIX TaxID=1759074 RepID=UPI0007366EDC|nr:OmpA family protein [Sphingopyxis sp. HIX]KTE36527.1 hypothetical protein ATE62_14310 [Sphingopyxis sp. HIX]KTE84517.1 hypothetical protein ATE72_08660 [Sphingopyxis sp. HXXIV]
MKRRAIICALLLALPSAGAAQEYSAEELAERIRATVGSEAAAPRQAPGATRTFSFENGVDSGRKPEHIAPPPKAVPAPPPRPAPSAETCTAAANFHGILFELGSARIADDRETSATLSELARALTTPDLAHLSLIIRGHTDTSGGDRVNLPLSQRRAEAVARRLIAAGVGPGRVRARGMGSSVLADPGDPTGFQNRRVDICF